MNCTAAGLLKRKELLVSLFFILVSGCFGQSATLNGIVTGTPGGNPVIGAKVTVGNHSTFSVFGGIYSLTVDPAGTWQVSCTKAGFEPYLSAPLNFISGTTVTLPISIPEKLNPPAMVTATLDTAFPPPFVNLSWQMPRGDYELLYDDGIMDNFTVWAVQGNMNAVKFTPAGYPVKVTGGKFHIGTASNYPAGTVTIGPFQVCVYDASGPGGKPGNLIAGPVTVLPMQYGWVDFSVPSTPQINSGDFYLVMIQLGNAPNATGMAIDETYPQFRSYTRFVSSGTTPWIPASGNFMMRAQVDGPGGPLLLGDTPSGVTGYTVLRLRQGEEQNPSIWTLLASVASTSLSDNSWISLPCGPYRWAVRADYTGNRTSPASFSGVIGKCWTVSTTVQVDLSCDSTSLTGITVNLTNLVYPDTLYNKPADANGTAVFPSFWKGSYEMKVSRFGYQDRIQNVSIDTDTTLSVMLLQNRAAPSGMFVNDSSLMARWNKPAGNTELFRESWESGSFLTHGWMVQGQNWGISQAVGNPMPSAMFSWSPPATQYEQSIVSRPIAGMASPVLNLQYDVFLNNYSTTSLNQLAVELWDGTAWHLLKNYTNSLGSIPWTSQTLNISEYSSSTIKIRFRAYGNDSYDINNWNVDNIVLTARESAEVSGDCILGYNLFLDNILFGFTTDTFYQVPPAMVQYGNSFDACVSAIYGSGTSAQSCHSFISRYLVPPSNLLGAAIEDVAYLSWNKPDIMMDDTASARSVPPGLKGYVVFRDGLFIDTIQSPDTSYFYEFGLYPGSYSYKVTSYYDLTPYGFPGIYAQSYPVGPVTVEIAYGRKLPFTEIWDPASFSYHDWTFTPEPGNWSVDVNGGNPSPQALFSGEPLRIGYSYSLESPVLDATSLYCANLWLDFDVRLQDLQSGGNEKLDLELFFNGNWHPLSRYTNQGSTGWSAQHINISQVKGKAFRIRFRANGIRSEDITGWNIDNIYVYGVCKPPRDLSAENTGNDVRLTWSAPVCEDGNPLNEGFEEEYFPPEGWETITTNNNNVTWQHITLASPAGVHSGAYAAGLNWDYSHQDEWLVAKNIEITGNLTFWSYGFQGSVHGDHYYVKLSEDQGNNWQILADLSSLPPYPSLSGYNEWQTPYVIDLSYHLGQVVDLAWQAVDGDGSGLWYAWIIDDCTIGTKKFLPRKAATGTGSYNVFRQDAGSGSYARINAYPVEDTTYLDPGLIPSDYRYYVTSGNPDCSEYTSSDTALISIVTGTGINTAGPVSLFPNPADACLNIVSAEELRGVELFDCLGEKVLWMKSRERKNLRMDLTGFRPGIYTLKITMIRGVCTKKITVIH